MKNDHRSKFSNLSNWKEEAWKNQGFNGIRTRDLRDTGVMLYQLSYEATHWERGQFIEFISPVRSEIYCDDHSSLWSTTAVQMYELFHIYFTPKSKSLFELFKERVIVYFGDYFCCIHIFSAKIFICSQTFVNLKYIKKLEISYEFYVSLTFNFHTNVRRFYWLYKTRIGGCSYSSTTDTLLAFYTNKTKQHLQK